MGSVGLKAFPAIESFSPTYGGPGTVVVINGSGFSGLTQVLFNNAPATSFTSTATRINVIVPADATSGLITVYTQFDFATSYTEFTVAPRVTGFYPIFGGVGDQVNIEGANFIVGATTIKFGSIAAAALVVSPSQVQTTVPTGAKTGGITVETFAGAVTSTTNFLVVPPGPYVTGFYPESVAPGDNVTINGVRLTGATSVAFNGVAASFVVTADTLIQALVPATAKSGPVTIATPLGTTISEMHLTIIGPAPTITDFTPVRGPAGTAVTITGKSFTDARGVSFGGIAAAFVVTADTLIQTIVPDGAVTGPIIVTNLFGGATSSVPFTVIAGPTITEFEPASAPVGSAVIVRGERFLGATNVAFNGKSANFTVVSDSQIHATVPTGAKSGKLTVSTPAGKGTSAASFFVLPPGPVIASVTPSFGNPGQDVQLTGSYLLETTDVRFNGVAAAFVVSSDTQIHATVPLEATTGPIVVTTSGGSTTNSTQFYVTARITAFTPASGAVNAEVQVMGANLAELTAASINGVPAVFTVVSTNEVRLQVPIGATTGPITLTTPAGSVLTAEFFTVTTGIDRFEPESGFPGTSVRLYGTGFLNATAVFFNGMAASFTVVSAGILDATVPQGATTGSIAMTSPSGAAQSSKSFFVGVSADLSVGLDLGPEPHLLNNSFTYSILVTNRGPSTASGVTVTNPLPAATAFVSSTANRGAAGLKGQNIVWTLSGLAKDAVAEAVITVIPLKLGSWTSQAVLQGNAPDPTSNNNQVTRTTQVRGLMDLNLLRNADAEAGSGATSASVTNAPAGWRLNGSLTAIEYGSVAGYPTRTSPGPANRGNNFFAGGPSANTATARQMVDLSGIEPLLDTGLMPFTLSGYLGGLGAQTNEAGLTAGFLAADDTVLLGVQVNPVTAADRTNTTALIARAYHGTIPAGTRRVAVTLVLKPGTTTVNTAFADNLSLVLHTAGLPAVTIEQGEGIVLLSWPSHLTNWVLQTTPLVVPAVWTNVSELPALISNRFILTNTVTNLTGFYRLQRD
jgi:uncharacterized repeat protein (TIGR01451 family)